MDDDLVDRPFTGAGSPFERFGGYQIEGGFEPVGPFGTTWPQTV